MKRSLSHLLLTASAASLLLVGPAFAQQSDVKVTVNGTVLNESPRLVDGRVLVPLRAIFEAVGAKVNFSGGVIEANGRGHKVVLKLGDTQAQVDGRPVTLDAPAQSFDGKTMVPLRFVATSFGAKVAWDPATRLIAIESTPQFEIKAVGDFDPRFDLKRLAIGNQASILKIFDDQRQEVVFFKGLDDRQQAKLTVTDRQGMRQALGIPDGRVHEAAEMLIGGYDQLPKRETVALLGVLASSQDLGTPEIHSKIQAFLVERMLNDKDIAVRRQATLALALCDTVDPATVEQVAQKYSKTDNLWETFPVQQFFEYHAGVIKLMPGYKAVVQQLGGVNSLYTPNILQYLQ